MHTHDALEVIAWAPTAAQVREAVLGLEFCAPDYSSVMKISPEGLAMMPEPKEIRAIVSEATMAVRAGRFIDFGWWSNEAIKQGSLRGGKLWNQKAIIQPFSDTWMFMHRWTPGEVMSELQQALGFDTSRQAVSVYLVKQNPHDPDELWACELQPGRFDNTPKLEIGDRVYMHRGEQDEYKFHVLPSMARFASNDFSRLANADMRPEQAAVSNVVDPLMLALLMLNTRNVSRETVEVSAKLQKARAKNGKPPIPNYEAVNSLPYITALSLSKAPRGHGEDQGGTHRSPTPHIRMGHPRTYRSGRMAIIQDTLVAVPPEQRAAWKAGRRSHYEVKP